MANAEVGSAYVSIFPNMKGFGSKINAGVKSAFGSVAKVAAAGGAAVAGAIGAISTASLSAYADYEQLIGGMEKLYGDSASIIKKNAEDAFASAQMSSNQYMQTATSFSAALIKSLGGNTEAAAKQADVAIRAMSDNASIFGTDLQTLQDAYKGFARGQFMMLDSLQLGYGGTKAGMEQLIADANRMKAANGEAANLSIDSFSDMVEAIQLVQEHMGIAGNAAMEASKTIQGSVAMMKSSWENWLTGLGDDNADMGQLTDNLINSLIAVADNVAPRVVIIADRIIENLPMVCEKIGAALKPLLVTAITNAWNSMAESLNGLGFPIPKIDEAQVSGAFGRVAEIISTALDTAQQAVQRFADGFMQVFNSPEIQSGIQQLQAALQPFVDNVLKPLGEIIMNFVVPALGAMAGLLSGVLLAAVTGIMVGLTGLSQAVQNLPQFFTNAGNMIQGAWNGLLSFIGGFVSSVVQFFTTLASNVITKASELVSGVVQFFSQLPGKAMNLFSTTKNNVVNVLTSLLSAAKSKAAEILNGIISKFAEAPGKARQKFNEVTQAISSTLSNFVSSAVNLGRNIIDGIIRGVSNGVGALVGAVKGAAQKALNAAKSLLGIHSPSREFAWIGSMVMEGWEQPITKGADSMAGAVGSVVDKMIGAADKGVTVPGLISAVGSEEAGASQVVSGGIQLFIDTINNYDTETDLILALNRALARAEVTGA